MGAHFVSDFSIGQHVRIKELATSGRISSIRVDRNGIMYSVRYFIDGQAEDIYFYEDELELIA